MPRHILCAGVAMLIATPIGSCASRGARTALAPEVDCRSSVLTDAFTEDADGVPAHWIMAADAGDQRRLDSWCAAVGTPVFGDVGRSRAEADSLAVITWNVYGGGADLARFVDDLRSGVLTAGEPVEHFALLLQEAIREEDLPEPSVLESRFGDRVAPPRSHARLDVRHLARELGLHLVYVPSMRNGRPGFDPAEDKGNAILSTLPLSEPTFVELPLERQRRVAALATVRGEDTNGRSWSFRLASVHLDNRSRPERLLDWFGAFRMRQARALIDALPPHEPLVLGGDLNTWSLRQLDRAPELLREHLPDAPHDDTRTMTLLGILPRRLDHLLARIPDGAARQPLTIDELYGSDHHAVLMWVLP